MMPIFPGLMAARQPQRNNGSLKSFTVFAYQVLVLSHSSSLFDGALGQINEKNILYSHSCHFYEKFTTVYIYTI